MYIKIHQTADITGTLLFYCTHKFYFSGVCIGLTEYAGSREKCNRFMPTIKTLACLAQEAEAFASLMTMD